VRRHRIGFDPEQSEEQFVGGCGWCAVPQGCNVGSTSFTILDLLRNKGGTVTATQLCSITGQVLLQQFSSITCYSRVENSAALVLRWIVTMLN
jgi:hypothetical protein